MCAEQNSRITHDERQLQILKYVKNHRLSTHKQNSDFDSYRFSRQIHNLVKKNGGSESNDVNDATPNLGRYHMYSLVFAANTSNSTINDLRPYTMYIFQFFACNAISCSSYYLYYDRTDSSPHADDIQLTVSIDPLNSNRVHLDFSEPPQPNGLTVAFHIEKHDLNNFKIISHCITRKQHYDNGQRYAMHIRSFSRFALKFYSYLFCHCRFRYTFEHLDKGQYSFRVKSVSLAMVG